MKALVALLPGDGIGPEVVAQGARVLAAIARRFGHELTLCNALIGGAAIEQAGNALPPSTLDLCLSADAVLLGAVGGRRWGPEAEVRPEQGLLELRRRLGLFANIRPASPHPRALRASPLKASVLEGVDLIIVRELTGGLYFGEKRRDLQGAVDTCVYTRQEVERVVRVACCLARGRRRKLTSVDKANVLETSRLWRSVCTQTVREEFPDIQLEHLLVDTCAMELVSRPSCFDVLVTENMFGDILSDEASVLCGSVGLMPSASLGEGARGLYEPIHGSAPGIAGRGVANPYGAISSVALLLRHSLGLEREAQAVEAAVSSALDLGILTADLMPESQTPATTEEAGNAVLRALEESQPSLGAHQPSPKGRGSNGAKHMAVIYYDRDATLDRVRARKVAIIGYGSQGHAHALNLQDSGINVRVGLHETSRSRTKAELAGLRVLSVSEAAREADLIVILTPDNRQKHVYDSEVRPYLTRGKALFVAHGFNIYYGQIHPPPDVDVVLIAPKGPGHLVRRLYQEGQGIPALIAIHQDATGDARALGLSYARAIGATRAGVLETTFKEETETDLFGEQAVLCGGAAALIKAGFDTLVEAGYQEESAYFQCVHELKLIADLMYEGGLAWMRQSVSDLAEYGDYTRGPRVISEGVRAEMKRILGEIQSGAFAREWMRENLAGRPALAKLRDENQAHPIEGVGERLREMMSWIRDSRKDSSEPSDALDYPYPRSGAV